MSPKFGYWSVQGLGQSSRMLLHFTGTECEDTVYTHQSGNWLKNKFNLGLDFPNLPYYIDDDVKLTQSTAILKYLGRKNNLYGSNTIEASQIDMLIATAYDLKMSVAMAAYNPDFENLKAGVLEKSDEKFQQLSTYLDKKQFLMGDNVTIADFAMFVALTWLKELDQTLVAKYPNINEYIDRFAALDKIKSFLTSDKNFSAFFAAFAKWKNTDDTDPE